MINKTVLNYRITDKIGEGGMGEVYLAIHEKLQRKAAIKILNKIYSTNQSIRERFLNEAVTLSKINHNNIVTLFDFAEIDDELMIIMEYVEGKTLDEIISTGRNNFSEQSAVNIFKQILQGFAYAHSKNIIHRDIKPSNIIINNEGAPKILDFGIAKIITGDLNLTQAGTRMGSPMYMSPEQVLGKDIDKRSDIYSLGVTFFEMLSCYALYGNVLSEYEIQNNIVNISLPSLKTINPNINSYYDAIIQKATQKNPDMRFSDCNEFLKALESGITIPEINRTQYSTTSVNNNTQIQTPHQYNTKKNNNFIFYIGGAAILLLAIVFLVNMIITNKSDSDEKSISSVNNNIFSKSDEKSTETKTKNQSETTQNAFTEREVAEFINEWCNDQTNHRIDAYVNKYNTSFSGIKRTKSGREYYYNYSSWVTDRRKMYQNATALSVSASNINILNKTNETAEISFTQYYISNNYTDEGTKKMKLVKDASGKITILFEELLYSKSLN